MIRRRATIRGNRFELDSWLFGFSSNNGGATYTGNILTPS